MFGLTPVSIKKTKVIFQEHPAPPLISIGNKVSDRGVQRPLNVSATLVLLLVASNLSPHNVQIDNRIAKAAAVMSRLRKRVWGNNQLTTNTKVKYIRYASSVLCYMVVYPRDVHAIKRIIT